MHDHGRNFIEATHLVDRDWRSRTTYELKKRLAKLLPKLIDGECPFCTRDLVTHGENADANITATEYVSCGLGYNQHTRQCSIFIWFESETTRNSATVAFSQYNCREGSREQDRRKTMRVFGDIGARVTITIEKAPAPTPP